MLRIGFDIGGTNMAAGAVDQDGRILARRDLPFPKGKPYIETVRIAESMIKDLLQETDTPVSEVSSMGFAVPGSIEADTGVIIDAHNLGFHNVPFRDAIRELYPMAPVFLINDANAAALGELSAGALKGCKTGILLTLGTGVGGGLILDGKLFNGGLSHGVEIGHMCIDRGGPYCTCGSRGCMETLCSATWLIREGRRAMCLDQNGMIFRKTRGEPDQVDGKLVIDCARAGDEKAEAIFSRYVEHLSTAVASLANLMDPEIIVLGGGISLAGDFLIRPVREQVREKSFFHHPYRIEPAMLGNDAGIIGAALAEL